MWQDGDVWIIGGGSSIPHQFQVPENVIQSVRKGEVTPDAYEPYMRYLKDKHVIGINTAFLIADWIDAVFFGDNKWFLAYKEKLKRFPGLKVTCNPKLTELSWVKYLKKDAKKQKGIHPNPYMVSWNWNSGAAAISFAANTGAKRIFLLGFDMTLGENKEKHWHTLYNRNRRLSKEQSRLKMPFDRHLKGFPEIKKDAEKRGIQIINVNHNSKIKEFPQINLSEL
jgi:hypothetical protein